MSYEKLINKIKSGITPFLEPIFIDAKEVYISRAFVELIKEILKSQTEEAFYLVGVNEIDVFYGEQEITHQMFRIYNIDNMISKETHDFIAGEPVTKKEKREITRLLAKIITLRRALIEKEKAKDVVESEKVIILRKQFELNDVTIVEYLIEPKNIIKQTISLGAEYPKTIREAVSASDIKTLSYTVWTKNIEGGE
jgi:hypothetical protein